LLAQKRKRARHPGFAALNFPRSGAAPSGRHDGPSLAQHASFGILPNAPLRNTCTRPSDGGIWTEPVGRFLLGLGLLKSKVDALLRLTIQCAPGQAPLFSRPNAIVVQWVERQDAARAVLGHGWPVAAGPRSNDWVREVERSEPRMAGASPLGYFWGDCQK
jgi:hypothetical protein